MENSGRKGKFDEVEDMCVPALLACAVFLFWSGFSFWYGARSRDKYYAKDHQRLARYIEACQWVASMRVSPYDIDCYSTFRMSDSMKKWAEETSKDPLEIWAFREYCNWLLKAPGVPG